jgi:predicted nucleic acid-binding Zn ribbon protein
MEDIKAIISELTQKRFKHEIEGLKVFERWTSIAGDRLAAISKPAFINNGVLIVQVDNSSALQEMIYNKQNLLKNINTQKDLPYIKDIKFNIKSGL